MKLNKVTITGADNSIIPNDLVNLSKEFPFVEWGILLSKSNEDNPRFPSKSWINELKKYNLSLSGHICGGWVRDLVVQNHFSFAEDRPEWLDMFSRIQLNFSPYHASMSFLDQLLPYKKQFLFQMGNKYREQKLSLLDIGKQKGLDIGVLFDRSGGKGKLPTNWPEPLEDIFCGYAGGLGPDNIQEQLAIMADTVKEREIWIDMEKHVRSEDDSKFELDKVRKVLEISKIWT